MIARLVIEDLALERGERRLFSGLSLAVGAGEAVALTGANGAGKTSLLRTVAGLIRPAVGRIVFETDAGASDLGGMDDAEARSSGLHLLGHHDGLKTGRTAREELAFWTAWMGGDAESFADAVRTFDLAALLPLEVRKLSAGQRRRVALARLIAAPRPLWLLDEPMAPLDVAQRRAFAEVMSSHLATGGLILAAIHDPLPIPARVIGIGSAALTPMMSSAAA